MSRCNACDAFEKSLENDYPDFKLNTLLQTEYRARFQAFEVTDCVADDGDENANLGLFWATYGQN